VFLTLLSILIAYILGHSHGVAASRRVSRTQNRVNLCHSEWLLHLSDRISNLEDTRS
jgi:hypothetical protein